MTVRILHGDCREVLRTLPDESVHCVVTSPPYWGLRDYGVAGQIGLEPSPQEYLDSMVELFREVRRVLRADGTAWVNMGDSYAGSGRGGNPTEATSTLEGGQSSQLASMVKRVRGADEIGGTARDAAVTNLGRRALAGKHEPACEAGALGRAWVPPAAWFKNKDLMGMPWRLALALQADGWYLRQDIIWRKPNPMPESIRDRCTKAHEYIFLLSKSERYFYDFDAVKEPASDNTHERRSIKMPDGWDTGAGGHGSFHRNGREKGKTRKLEAEPAMPGATIHNGLKGHSGSKLARPGSGIKNNESFDEAMAVMPDTRNKRSVWDALEDEFQQFLQWKAARAAEGELSDVWSVATHAFPEAHFATFPPDLIEPCILAGTSEGGCCSVCGAPQRRVLGAPRRGEGRDSGNKERKPGSARGCPEGTGSNVCGSVPWEPTIVPTVGWEATCGCDGKVVPCVVLDLFGGAGTTGLVADRNGRDAILIELNPEYADMASRRIKGDAPLFAEVTS